MPKSDPHEEIARRVATFREAHYSRLEQKYRDLVEHGQSPRTLFITCSDSRVVPHFLSGADPGELFILRTVGGIVPPYSSADQAAGAAIEYAVVALEVRNIVLCAHSHCGAIRGLYQPPNPAMPHLNAWLEYAREAALDAPESEAVLRETEQRGVRIGVQRLLDYPAVAERVAAGTLELHGFYYVIEEGDILVLDRARGVFDAV